MANTVTFTSQDVRKHAYKVFTCFSMRPGLDHLDNGNLKGVWAFNISDHLCKSLSFLESGKRVSKQSKSPHLLLAGHAEKIFDDRCMNATWGQRKNCPRGAQREQILNFCGFFLLCISLWERQVSSKSLKCVWSHLSLVQLQKFLKRFTE